MGVCASDFAKAEMAVEKSAARCGVGGSKMETPLQKGGFIKGAESGSEQPPLNNFFSG